VNLLKDNVIFHEISYFASVPIEECKEGARHIEIHLLDPELDAVQLHAHRQEGGDPAQDGAALAILEPVLCFQIQLDPSGSVRIRSIQVKLFS
jgi:hypothetical protein